MEGDVVRLVIARRKGDEQRRGERRAEGEAQEDAAVLFVALRQQVEGADRGHHEPGGDDGGEHGVEVLPAEPGVGQQGPEADEAHAVGAVERVSDRVLHPGVRSSDEVARKPGAGEEEGGRRDVSSGPEFLFAEENEAEMARVAGVLERLGRVRDGQ